MLDENIELSNNYIEVNIVNLDEIDELLDDNIVRLANLKINFILKELNQVRKFNEKSSLLPLDKHICVVVNRHLFDAIDQEKIVNNFLIKNLNVEELIISLHCYSASSISEPIVQNNYKILNRMYLLFTGINSLSKTREIIYNSRNIIKDYKIKEENINTLKTKMNYVSSLANKM